MAEAAYLDLLLNKSLTIFDNDFIQYVTSDVYYFQETNNLDSALIFPPVSNFHRLIIHKIVETIPGLSSFSVGEGSERRTVVFFEERLLSIVSTSFSQESSPMMDIDKVSARMKRPDQAIYNPPCKKIEEKVKKDVDNLPVKKSCGKKERGVYVPPGRRRLEEQKKAPATRDDSGSPKSSPSPSVKQMPSLPVKQKSKPSPLKCSSTYRVKRDTLCERAVALNRKPEATKIVLLEKQGHIPVEGLCCVDDTGVSNQTPASTGDGQTSDDSPLQDEVVECGMQLVLACDRALSHETDVVNSCNDNGGDEVEKWYNCSADLPGACSGERDGVSDCDDTWDKMYGDDGSCLDPEILSELTMALGEVTVQMPQFEYASYKPKGPTLDESKTSHILEMFDFSPDWQTADLLQTMCHHPWHDDFTIKWVDDTHALAIFSDAYTASQALSTSHPLVKMRPMSQATVASRKKAHHAAEFVQPYRPRPQTSVMAMRRMVGGALGIRVSVSEEQKQKEKKQLQEARDKKKQARIDKDEIWGRD